MTTVKKALAVDSQRYKSASNGWYFNALKIVGPGIFKENKTKELRKILLENGKTRSCSLKAIFITDENKFCITVDMSI